MKLNEYMWRVMAGALALTIAVLLLTVMFGCEDHTPEGSYTPVLPHSAILRGGVGKSTDSPCSVDSSDAVARNMPECI
jgi:hypothetical protein